MTAFCGAWLWVHQNRVRNLAQQKTRKESERLSGEGKAESKEVNEVGAFDEARLLSVSEELSQEMGQSAGAVYLAEEQRPAIKELAMEAEEKRQHVEKAVAEVEASEDARLKAEAETKQRAETESREKARMPAEEEQRTETLHPSEELAREDSEACKQVPKAAEEKGDRKTDTEVEKEITPGECSIETFSSGKSTGGRETPSPPPMYQPIAPPPTIATSRSRLSTGSPTMQTSNADLRLRVQLVFRRGGVVRGVAIVPDRREGMQAEVEVTGTQGNFRLNQLREDCYEPVALADSGTALLKGIVWRGMGDARRWRWVLGGRELYVLAPGDEFGLHGFISTTRLLLNSPHAILATKRLRDEVIAALTQAGCYNPEIRDETDSGVPDGWLLFRNVFPTRAVPMRDARDILNTLCPSHEIELHFVGGIRLERQTWLAGYPPRIRLTGAFWEDFEVKIDGRMAQRTCDGSFEAPGWDSEGEHRLWFGDRAETYSLCTMDESWEEWPAYDFGTGVAICGSSICSLDKTCRRQVRVPVSNPLLIGARPGEVFRSHVRRDIRFKTLLTMVPFEPVWALPVDPSHADKESVRVLLLHPNKRNRFVDAITYTS